MSAIIVTPVLTACGDDSPISPAATGARLAFDAPTASRAFAETSSPEWDDSATTTLNIQEFAICAKFPNGGVIMDNSIVRRTGINSWAYSPEMDWPGQPIDFFAVSPIKYQINVWSRAIYIYSFPCTDDLVTSAMLNVNQTHGRLRINFAHATALVRIKLYSSTSDRDYYVQNLGIVDLGLDGSFLFPYESTSIKPGGNDVSDCWNVYNLNQTEKVIYSAPSADTGMRLTKTPQFFNSTGARFFIPIKFKKHVTEPYRHGTAIEIVYRASDTSQWTTSYIPLDVYTPDARWRAGVRYTYTIDVAKLPAEWASRGIDSADIPRDGCTLEID